MALATQSDAVACVVQVKSFVLLQKLGVLFRNVCGAKDVKNMSQDVQNIRRTSQLSKVSFQRKTREVIKVFKIVKMYFLSKF